MKGFSPSFLPAWTDSLIVLTVKACLHESCIEGMHVFSPQTSFSFTPGRRRSLCAPVTILEGAAERDNPSPSQDRIQYPSVDL